MRSHARRWGVDRPEVFSKFATRRNQSRCFDADHLTDNPTNVRRFELPQIFGSLGLDGGGSPCCWPLCAADIVPRPTDRHGHGA